MTKGLIYTVQFTEEEFDQLVGDLYYYFRHLQDEHEKLLRVDEREDREQFKLNDEEKEYFARQPVTALFLQSKLEFIRNKADITNPLYILKEVEINE